MIVAALDIGSSSTKALVYDGEKLQSFRFCLSYFPQPFSQKTVFESLRRLEELSELKILGRVGEKPAKVYVTTSLPLGEDLVEKGLATAVDSASAIISDWQEVQGSAVLELGNQFIHYGEKVALLSFDVGQAARWLPFKITLSEIQNYWDNRQIYANAQPVFPHDFYLEQAIAREQLLYFAKSQELNLRVPQIILSGGVFSSTPNPSQALLVFMDTLSFPDSSSGLLMAWDRHGLIEPVAALRKYEPQLLSFAQDFLPVGLGSLLRFGQAVQLELDLGLQKPLLTEVAENSLFVLPLSLNQTAKVRVRDKRGKIILESEVSGGELGVVVDSRPFPLSLPTDSRRRFDQIKDWERQMTGANPLNLGE